MSAPDQKPGFVSIALKYKNLEAFVKVAKTTFAKGRMTLKSKKDLAEGQRISISISIPERADPIQIVSEVIHKVKAEVEAEGFTYGVRWLTFTEKKLAALEAGEATPAPMSAKTGAAPKTPTPPPQAATPPPKTTTTAPAPAAKPSPPPAPAPAEATAPATPPAKKKVVKKVVKKAAPAKAEPPPAQAPPPPPAPPPKPAAPPPAKPPAPAPAPAKKAAATPKAKPVAKPAEAPDADEAADPEASPPAADVSFSRIGDQIDLDGLLADLETEDANHAAAKAAALAEEPDADTSLDLQPFPDDATPPELAPPEPELPAPPPEPPPPAPEPPVPAPIEAAAPPPLAAEGMEGPAEPATAADLFADLAPAPEPAAPPAAPPAPLAPPPLAAEPATSAETVGPEPVEDGPEAEDDDLAAALAPEPPPPPRDDEMLELGPGDEGEDEELEAPAPSPAESPPAAPAPETEAASAPAEALAPEAEVAAPTPAEVPAPAAPRDASPLAGLSDKGELLDTRPQDQTLARAVQDEQLEEEEYLDDAAGKKATEEVVEAPKPRFLGPEALEALGAFLLRLLKLLLNPDLAKDQGADRDLKALYDEFKRVMTDRDDIVVYLRGAGAVREYMLAGDCLDPVNLKKALAPEQFDALAVKLAEFCGKKRLLGAQFRRYLTEAAFREFVVILGEYDPVANSPMALASALLGEGVFHVSPVHEVDRIPGSEELDFRVEMILSRLRGDLTRIGPVAEAMGEDPGALWTLRLEDALKSLDAGRLRAEVLLRADRIAAGQQLITASELIQEIVLATPEEMVGEAGEALAKIYAELYGRREAQGASPELEAELEAAKNALRQVTARLMVDAPDVGHKIMYDLYRTEVFTLEELPPELRDRAMVDQFIDAFIADPDRRLADFSAIKDPRNYRGAALRYARMVAELVRRENIESADKIFRTLVEHIKLPDPPFAERPLIAQEAFALLSAPDSLEVLIEVMAGAGKQDRDKLAALIYACGPAAVGRLIEILTSIEDKALRRVICRILTLYGEPVAPTLVARINDPASPWYLVRNLLMVLGDMPSPALADQIDRLADHAHPRVREEALAYAAKLLGPLSETHAARGLHDQDPAVRRKAAVILNHLPAIADQTLADLATLLETRPKKEPTPEEEQVTIEAAAVIAKQAGRALPDGRGLEDLLIAVLEADMAKGLFSRLAGQKALHGPKTRAAIIKALGETGADKAKKTLKTLAKEKDPIIRESAELALARLEAK